MVMFMGACVSLSHLLLYIQQATNDYIEATSQGLHHPHLRYTADRMAAVSSNAGAHNATNRASAGREPTDEFTDIYSTPGKGMLYMYMYII